MTRLLSISVFLLVLAALPANAMGKRAHHSDPTVVPSVDLKLYSGLWHEAARYSTYFQKDCVRSTAEYGVRSDGKLSVFNTCYLSNGKTRTIRGVAYNVDKSAPAKLRVKFNFFLYGDYWIVDLDPSYRYAIVSGPAESSLFVLVRDFPVEPELWQVIQDRLVDQGFNLNRLVYDR